MSRSQSEGPPAVQSYPSFWDAIPVDPPPAPRPAKDDAYARFALAAEGTPAVLTVDRLEVN